MATSPIYGFELPDDTDLVKDGALAMRTLGDDVDSTLGTALNNKLHGGLVLVSNTTIGSAVSSLTITNAFSTNYDNYKIMVSGSSVSTGCNLLLSLSSITGSVYSNSYEYAAWGSGTSSISATTSTNVFVNQIDGSSPFACEIELFSPFLSKKKFGTTMGAATTYSGRSQFYIDSTVSSTNLIFTTTSSATLTGGTIAVYGYAKD